MSITSESTVDQRLIGRLLEISLHRPGRGNAFDYNLLEGINEALDGADPASIDTIVFRGKGKGFCGGLDLTELSSETDASLLDRLVRIELLLQRVAALPQQTISLVHNFAYGAGADLAIACQRCIAAPGTRFSFPGVSFGIALGTGRLGRKIGSATASRLLRSPEPITAEKGLECGLVDEVKDRDRWEEWVEHTATRPQILGPDIAMLIAGRLDRNDHDSDLAALVRSAATPGLRQRVADHAARVKEQAAKK